VRSAHSEAYARSAHSGAYALRSTLVQPPLTLFTLRLFSGLFFVFTAGTLSVSALYKMFMVGVLPSFTTKGEQIWSQQHTHTHTHTYSASLSACVPHFKILAQQCGGVCVCSSNHVRRRRSLLRSRLALSQKGCGPEVYVPCVWRHERRECRAHAPRHSPMFTRQPPLFTRVFPSIPLCLPPPFLFTRVCGPFCSHVCVASQASSSSSKCPPSSRS